MRLIVPRTLVASALLCSASLATAQRTPDSAPTDLDTYVTQVLRTFSVPGMAVTIDVDQATVSPPRG